MRCLAMRKYMGRYKYNRGHVIKNPIRVLLIYMKTIKGYM